MQRLGFACIAGLVMLPGTALAQNYNVVSGHSTRVYYTYATNPDCTSIGQIVVRLTQPPQHGRVTIRNGSLFPNFPASNVRNVCNGRRVPGVEAYYVSEPAYTGSDSAAFEAIYPHGEFRQYTAYITVR